MQMMDRYEEANRHSSFHLGGIASSTGRGRVAYVDASRIHPRAERVLAALLVADIVCLSVGLYLIAASPSSRTN